MITSLIGFECVTLKCLVLFYVQRSHKNTCNDTNCKHKCTYSLQTHTYCIWRVHQNMDAGPEAAFAGRCVSGTERQLVYERRAHSNIEIMTRAVRTKQLISKACAVIFPSDAECNFISLDKGSSFEAITRPKRRQSGKEGGRMNSRAPRTPAAQSVFITKSQTAHHDFTFFFLAS